MSHYDVLGVTAEASMEEVRRAYLRLARRHHPDVASAHGSGEAMRRVNAAWDVIGDPQRRAAYDRTLGVGPVAERVRRGWQPLEPDGPEDGEPVDWYDEVGVEGSELPVLLQLGPPAMVTAGVVLLIVGAVTSIPLLFPTGLALFIAGLVLLGLVPVVAVFLSARASRRGP